MVKWQMAEKVKSSAIQSVASSISAAHKLEIDENRHYIICIIRCILLCALQGTALRGHREQIDADNSTLNRGNFLAIVSLTSVYDDVVRKRLHSGPQNAKYVHHDIQNDILSSASSLVRQLIVAQVVEAGLYAVIADETRDTSKAEQMSIVLRYVRDGEIHEAFLCFKECQRLDAGGLCETILDTLQTSGIDPQRCCSQCYDGAAV